MKRVLIILFCTHLFAQHTKLPMNISEVLSLGNETYTVPAGHVLQTLPLGTVEDPFEGTIAGTVGINDGVSGGWWTVEKIILTEGYKISSNPSSVALLYNINSVNSSVKGIRVIWYNESYTVPDNTIAEVYSVYSAGINGNPDQTTFRRVNETSDRALSEGMFLASGDSVQSWGVLSLIEYHDNNLNSSDGFDFIDNSTDYTGLTSSIFASTNKGIQSRGHITSPEDPNIELYNNASGEGSFAVGQGNTSSGIASNSFGRSTVASGYASSSFGYKTEASGGVSVAFGSGTKATGDEGSFVFGKVSEASGSSSFSGGFGSIASGQTAVSLGYYNKSLGAASFSVGSLNEAQTDYSIAAGSDNTSSGFAAVTFGFMNTTSGQQAFSVGTGNTASGNQSIAIGSGNTSSGIVSTALGSSTISSGEYSTTTGKGTTASGNYSTAMGIDNIASGEISLATGGGTTASGFNSTSFGSHTTASGGNSVAMGHYTKASDYGSLVIGYYNDSGSSITAFDDRYDDSNTAFVIGNGAGANNRSDALTVLFDGTTTIAGDLNVNSDKKVFFGNQSFIEGAVEGTVLILNTNNNILFRPGGTTTVNFEPNGDAIFNGDVKVTSDKRLKANIVSLGATLSKLLQIDGKSYIMKKDESEKQKIGLLAQDIEKVFPELVSESNGIKSVNYQGLVPVLINALKEQQSEIDELKSMVLELVNNN